MWKEWFSNGTIISFTAFSNRNIDLSAQRLLLLSVLRPSIEYGSEVWKCNKSQASALESLLLGGAKTIPGYLSMHRVTIILWWSQEAVTLIIEHRVTDSVSDYCVLLQCEKHAFHYLPCRVEWRHRQFAPLTSMMLPWEAFLTKEQLGVFTKPSGRERLSQLRCVLEIW